MTPITTQTTEESGDDLPPSYPGNNILYSSSSALPICDTASNLSVLNDAPPSYANLFKNKVHNENLGSHQSDRRNPPITSSTTNLTFGSHHPLHQQHRQQLRQQQCIQQNVEEVDSRRFKGCVRRNNRTTYALGIVIAIVCIVVGCVCISIYI